MVFRKGNKVRLGINHTQETIEKIRKKNSGKTHPMYGRTIPDKLKKEMSLAREGDKNPNWKGDKITVSGVHAWVKRHKPKPEYCENCNEKKSFDLANISGEYKRDVNDFQWVCRRCHMDSDGRLACLIRASKQRGGKN